MAPRLLPSNDPARAPTDVFYDLQLLFPTALSAKTRGATLIPIKYLQLSKQCAAGAWAPRGRQARPTEPLSLDSRCDSTRLQCPVENDTGPRHGAVPEAVGLSPRPTRLRVLPNFGWGHPRGSRTYPRSASVVLGCVWSPSCAPLIALFLLAPCFCPRSCGQQERGSELGAFQGAPCGATGSGKARRGDSGVTPALPGR